MGRWKKWNESERKQILELQQQRLSIAKISKLIRRSRKVIQNFLKNVEDYGKKKSTGRLLSLSDRAILRVASNSQLTTKQIMEKSSVSATVSSIRRVLLFCKDIKGLKLEMKPSLITKHKVERLRFAKERAKLDKETEKGTIFRRKKIQLGWSWWVAILFSWHKRIDNVSNSTTNGRRQRDGLARLFRQDKYQVHQWQNE